MARVTLKDVAARAEVSYQTVSKVLNNKANVSPETEERIWEAVRALNYRPNVSARNLRTQSSNLIGYAWRRSARENGPHPVLDQFLYHAANGFEEAGFHLLTFLVGSDEDLDVRPYRELYGRRQVEGFILADTETDDARVAYLIEQEIPFASFGQANDEWDFCWVDVDGRYGLSLVTEHLLQAGHERIALITWPEGSQAGSHREEGYLATMAEAGRETREEWIVRGENTVEDGRTCLNRLLQLPGEQRPTAVACVSDHLAIGATQAAMAAGLVVGDDLAITGYDNVPLAEFLYPPLTTVRQPIPAVGQALVDLLLKQINGEEIAEKGVLLRPELIVRESG